jgi:hypothetical protein
MTAFNDHDLLENWLKMLLIYVSFFVKKILPTATMATHSVLKKMNKCILNSEFKEH